MNSRAISQRSPVERVRDKLDKDFERRWAPLLKDGEQLRVERGFTISGGEK